VVGRGGADGAGCGVQADHARPGRSEADAEEAVAAVEVQEHGAGITGQKLAHDAQQLGHHRQIDLGKAGRFVIKPPPFDLDAEVLRPEEFLENDVLVGAPALEIIVRARGVEEHIGGDDPDRALLHVGGEQLALAHHLGVKLVDVKDDAVFGVGAADDEEIDVPGELAIGRFFQVAEQEFVDLAVRLGLEQHQVGLFGQGLEIDMVEFGGDAALVDFDAPFAGGAVVARHGRGDDLFRPSGQAVLLPELLQGALLDQQLLGIGEVEERGRSFAAEVLRDGAVEIKAARDGQRTGVRADGQWFSSF